MVFIALCFTLSLHAQVQEKVVAGFYHSVALKSDGTVWSWGSNEAGELGDGSRDPRLCPAQVPGLTGFVDIGAGECFTVALKSDGTVWSWGLNDKGQLGDGTHTDRWVPTQVPGLTGVVAISGGYQHVLALKSDGTVWTWGSNACGWFQPDPPFVRGQLGNSVPTTVLDSPFPNQIIGLNNVVAVAAGAVHSIVLKADGTVWTWGFNTAGELGIGIVSGNRDPIQVQGVSGVVAISGVGQMTVMLKSNGTVWSCGDNYGGQQGDGTTTNRYIAGPVNNLSGVVAIASSWEHVVALKSNGTVWGWGYNYNGEVGDGTATRRLSPVQVLSLTNVAKIWAGGIHSLAMTSDGSLWAWGWNTYGQLGDHSKVDRWSPIRVRWFNLLGSWADTDSDGLPDFWENLYLGGLVQNGSNDADGDGLTNLQEWNLDTNPSLFDTNGDSLGDGLLYGMKLWLRADAGLHHAIFPLVEQWENLALAGKGSAIQFVDANRPRLISWQQNGLPAVQFDGIDDFFQTVPISWSGNEYSYFFVWKKEGAPTGTHTVFNRAGTMAVASNNFQFTSANGAAVGKNDAVGSNADASTTNKFSTTFSYVSVVRQNSTAKGTKIFVNGLIDGESGTSTSSVLVGPNYPFFIGGWNTSRANMSLAEILVYDRRLSDSERISVEQYLRTRYAFPTPTLPAPLMTPLTGTFVGSVTVTLSPAIPMPGAEIRYTLDGTTPTLSSTLYIAPIVLTSTKMVRAKAFLSGYTDSAIVQNTFTVETGAPYTGLVTTGMKFWTMADRGVIASSGKVSSWADQSGFGNAALQGTSSKQPLLLSNQINGKPVIKFDGTNDYLMAVSPTWTNSDYSYFVVWKKDANAVVAGHSPLARANSLTSPGSHFQLWNTNGTSVLNADALGTDSDAVSTSTYATPSPYISVGVTRKNNTSKGTKLYVNGSLQGESSITATNTAVGTTGYEFYIGALGTAYGNLSVAEILVYDKSLSDPDRQSVESYLSQKYAISGGGGGGSDSDADGLPDSWEMLYFGNLSQTASGDPDADGMSNRLEYLFARNPTKGVVADTTGVINFNLFTPLE
jgi:alpha-tubulin suppressor-like RCC1 family protein